MKFFKSKVYYDFFHKNLKSLILKKKIFQNLFLHKLKLQILSKYLFLILKQEPKNSYVNVITIAGQVIFERHTGCLYKTSLRKTTYAFEHLLLDVTSFLTKLGLKKKKLCLIVKGHPFKRGLKKKLFNCLNLGLSFNQLIIKPLIAHNGVRLKRQRRK